MKKRKSATLLVMAMIGIGILFAGTNVMALDDCNKIWTTGTSASKFSLNENGGSFTFFPTNYTFKFIGVTPVTCPSGVSCIEGTKVYRWNYAFNDTGCLPTPSPSPVSNLQILVPSPVVDDQNIYYCGNNFGLCTSITSQPGTGNTSYQNKYFGFGLWQSQTILLTPDDSSGQYYYYSKKPSTPSPTSMYYKGGSNEFFAATLGPSTPEETFIPFNSVEDKTFGDYLVRIYRDRGSWCASTVEYSADGGTSWISLVEEEQPPGTLRSCGPVDGNQRCQECVVYTENSPGCYTYTSGGRTYKIPNGCI